MHAAALRVELYLRESRSLKTKRSIVRPIVEGLRKRHRVAVSEVDHQEVLQRATLGVATVAASHSHLVEMLDEVERFLWSFPEVEVLSVDRRWIEEELL